MIEAMFFYTPVIVAPYNEFVEEFGDNIKFGRYIRNSSVEELSTLISEIFEENKKEYELMGKELIRQ